ncbi:MAG TPA: DUF1841 family protein [Spirochaetota bacterium]|nr:DUF1841 family protein [Spirochaetota bacterium]HPC41879.1 DUF1841 family protein [Spirochaetota bacterium]HPL18133.1 DUF1841 family protein [Spirochaetota bacterium]HQF09590.1 DUF1841 family protein [Spirochaetota bacterium]HQH98340.1 DUF1841 family protein [Spirochaetota bacterium]
MTIEDGLDLHKIIMQSIETQIRDNDPPAIKSTFDRLVSGGHDEADAKEMIASVIAEEIYLKMKENRTITEETFAARLAELQ